MLQHCFRSGVEAAITSPWQLEVHSAKLPMCLASPQSYPWAWVCLAAMVVALNEPWRCT